MMLEWENRILWMVKLDDFWQNNSVQSIIALVLRYMSLKHSGIISVTMSLVAHIST